MKDLIPTVKITNFAGVSSIKDGMKSNAYSKVEREKKTKLDKNDCKPSKPKLQLDKK